MDSRQKRDARNPANSLLTLKGIASAANRAGVKICFVGSTLPFLETKVRGISDIDLVVDGELGAKKLFSNRIFKGGLEFNRSQTAQLAQSGQYFARFNDVRIDIYTHDLAGIPVSQILKNSRVFSTMGRELPVVSPEMYFVLKARISDFSTARLTGQMHKGFGRGEASAKKDLQDICLILNKVDFRKVESILTEMPPQIRSLVEKNICFIESARLHARQVSTSIPFAREFNRRVSQKMHLTPEEIGSGIVTRANILLAKAPKPRKIL